MCDGAVAGLFEVLRCMYLTVENQTAQKAFHRGRERYLGHVHDLSRFSKLRFMREWIALIVVALAVVAVVPTKVASQQEEAAHTRTIVRKVSPVYPEIARRLQLRGIVKVEVTVPAS